MVTLGSLPAGHDSGGAIVASADGSVVVGWTGVQGGGASQLFRWTRQTGIVQLGNSGAVSDASDDANVIVGGTITDRGWEPFRWTAETGVVALGCLPGAQRCEAEALAVSGDGSVVVGWSVIAKGWEAFRWTAADGMVALGALPGDVVESGATAVSADASVIMGISGNRLFRWTEATGILDAGCAPNDSRYIGLFDVSADASVGVGTYGTGDALGAAFIWDAQRGARNLQTVLTTEYGLDLAGWNLYEAHDVSADGRTIVGSGLNPTRHYEGWVAVIPEPATVTFALIALLILRPRRR
jgi:probable HAF family extracellular repeat protein